MIGRARFTAGAQSWSSFPPRISRGPVAARLPRSPTTERRRDSDRRGLTRGATIMGRIMLCGGPGPWGTTPGRANRGDNPPYHPVFVLTPSSARATRNGGRNNVSLRDGGHRVGAQASKSGRRRDGCPDRRRRELGPAASSRRAPPRDSRLRGRFSSAAPRASSTTSASPSPGFNGCRLRGSDPHPLCAWA
jgi:hypothetical protein